MKSKKLNLKLGANLLKRHLKHLSPRMVKAFNLMDVAVIFAVVGFMLAIVILGIVVPNIQHRVFVSKIRQGTDLISQSSRSITFANGGTLAGTFSNLTDVKANYEKFMTFKSDCDSSSAKCWPTQRYFLNGTSENADVSNSPSIVLNSDIAIHFATCGDFSTNCSSDYCGSFNAHRVCYAVNLAISGLNGKKTWGKDLFRYWVLDDGSIVPGGTVDKDVFYPSSTDCTSTGSGYGCAAMYLRQ